MNKKETELECVKCKHIWKAIIYPSGFLSCPKCGEDRAIKETKNK